MILLDWPAPYWYVDAGMAGMAALLCAVDQGLGACFFGVPTAQIPAVRAVFGVPDDQLSVGVISLGYPAPTERPSGSPTRRTRRPTAALAPSQPLVAGPVFWRVSGRPL